MITAKYTYSFTRPTLVLTLGNAEESVITGIIASGRIVQADEAIFVSAQKEVGLEEAGPKNNLYLCQENKKSHLRDPKVAYL